MESLIIELKKLGPIQMLILIMELVSLNLVGAICWLILFIMWNE